MFSEQFDRDPFLMMVTSSKLFDLFYLCPLFPSRLVLAVTIEVTNMNSQSVVVIHNLRIVPSPATRCSIFHKDSFGLIVGHFKQ